MTDHALGGCPPGLRALLDDVLALRTGVLAEGEALYQAWQPRLARPPFDRGARNLADYLALRRRDLRPFQRDLTVWGATSLGGCESRVEPALDAVAALLAAACPGHADAPPFPAPGRFFEGEEAIEREASHIFGAGHHGRDTRIMVTLPSAAAEDETFAEAILRAGAECVRINCAHDDPDAWAAMIANVRRAEALVGNGRRTRVLMDLGGPKVRTVLRHKDTKLVVETGDTLMLVKDVKAKVKGDGLRIGCSLAEALDQVAVGAPVWIDDGQIGCVVTGLTDDGAVLTVVQAPPGGKKIRPDKGLNFPDTDLTVAPLTEKDRADLAFVAEHADMVGYSFVQSAADVALLQAELALRLAEGQPPPAIVLKIETKRAVRHLPEIVAQAAGQQPTAVMIARGDLAVELGYQRMAEVQEEILWLCEAAHIPVIWATQVLERLAKEGVPSRSEVSDAALADRAECVMLNKGPYTVEAVRLLDDVLVRMQGHQRKKFAQLRALQSWQSLFEDDQTPAAAQS